MSETLNKYHLQQVLGKGAMGVVYEGYDPIIARKVAIKTIKRPVADDVEMLESLARFKREAQAAGRLIHPNIVGVFDYGETSDLAYIVMEFVEGETLKDILAKNEEFTASRILSIMEGLLSGIEYSHSCGVVHRDIKPANIIITKSGDVKISDFGIARLESSSMTQVGTMLGTPAYMSPEQFMGQAADARTDLYSAGVLLYQLLTGEKPFDGGLTAIMHKVLHTDFVMPSALSVAVTPALDEVVRRATAKRPAERFSSASEFLGALRRAYEQKSTFPINSGLDKFSLQDADTTMVRASPALSKKPALPVLEEASKGISPAIWGVGLIALVLCIAAGASYALLGRHEKPLPVTASLPPAVLPAISKSKTMVVPALTPIQIQADVTATLGAIPCTFLNARFSDNHLLLTGLVGIGAPQAALIAALKSLSGDRVIINKTQPVDGPYCTLLDIIHPYHPLFVNDDDSRLQLSLAGGKTELYNGDRIIVDQIMPNFNGYLTTDYFSSDGSVLHLYPITQDPSTMLAANAVKTLGDPAHGGVRWQVSAPFGMDIVISIASTVPLFPRLEPEQEMAGGYLEKLRTALQNAASNGGSIAVSALPVVTLFAGAGE